MISIEEILEIHSIMIAKYGGSQGVREINALESALQRPFQTFDGNELYANPIQKAAALLESILINHPFVDGNKRTAYAASMILLMDYNVEIQAAEDDKYDFVINAASGKINYDHIVDWLLKHTITIL